MLNKKEIYEKVKSDFLTENQLEEIDIENKTTRNTDITEINLENEEVWLMQCPKGTDLSQLMGHKLKFPGRSTVQGLECLSTEYNGKKQEAFGYASKGQYNLRLLPVSGSIVVRETLRANEEITAEKIDAAYVHVGRAAMPNLVKVRHPLFGTKYKSDTKLNAKLKSRLQEADENSAKITKDYRSATKIKIKQEKGNSGGVGMKRKSKMKVKEEAISPLKKKIKQEVSEDLQWLQNV